MDPRAVLAAFDEQVRRDETAEPGDRVESDDSVLRVVSDVGGWSGVAWTALDTTTADAVIAAEVERFAGTGVEWEWKYYSYDQPDDLAQRLVAAGLRPDPEESLMVAEIADLDVSVALPDGVHLRPVTDAPSAAALVAAAEEAFDEQYEGLGERLLALMASQPSSVAAVVAMAGERPIACGRIRLPATGDFASLWGGGTVPDWRRRGVFRALVAHRAAIARDRGFRYLQVDAAAASRPILQRLGFVELAKTTPYRMLSPQD